MLYSRVTVVTPFQLYDALAALSIFTHLYDALSARNYSRSIELDSNYADAYYSRAIIYHHQEDFEHALVDYSEVIHLQPNYTYAYTGRGNIYFNQGNYDQALSEYTKAITLDPNYEDALYWRGLAYQALGKKDDAINDFQKALELTSDVNKRTEIEKQLKTLEMTP